MSSRFWTLLTYRLPAKVDLARIDTMDTEDVTGICPLMPSKTPRDQLLDKIIASEYCRPLTLHDLTYYCDHVEHSGENLQFYLDYLEYLRLWDLLSEEEQSASPPAPGKTSRPRLKKSSPFETVQTVSEDKQHETAVTILESKEQDAFSFVSSLRSSSSMTANDTLSIDTYREPSVETVKDPTDDTASLHKHVENNSVPCTKIRELVKAEASIDWSPPAGLPLRKQVEAIVLKYFLTSSPQQLNLGYSVSLQSLIALDQTSHPSALKAAADHVRQLLVKGTLPNFLRYSANNANTPRKWSTFIAAVLALLVVSILTILNIVQRKPVAMRAIGIPVLWFGMINLLASLRGSCFVLFLQHRVQSRPYEPLADASETNVALESQDTAGGHNNNSESWVARWKRKSLFHKLHEQTHTTTGPFREMQDAIMVQSLVGGFVVTCFVSVLVGLIPVLH